MDDRTRTERIKQMEDRLDRCLAAVAAMEEALDRYEEAGEDIRLLGDYYTSPEWMEDFEADEAGEIPADIKRGVLSEDGICNLLARYEELETRIVEYPDV